MIKEGIVFGNFDSLREEMILTYRDDPPPKEKENKVNLPFVQGAYDFSRLLGEAARENREITYEFFIKENNVERRKILEIQYENMLLKQGFGKIYDTANPKYYYRGKCTEATVSFDESWRQLKLTVVFDCYPYMVSELPEGHDIWDEIIFDLDVFQPVEFEVVRTNFKPVKVGSYVTLGAWAGAFDGGDKIPKEILGVSRLVEDKRSTTQNVSKVAYKLAGIDQWIIEQDIVQAQNGVTKINLINNGATSIIPKVTSTNPISIVKGNEVFNVWKGVSMSERFMLDVGDNHMELTGNYPTEVHFEFYKELI